MKNEKMLHAIGKISEAYIEEASPQKKQTKRRLWIKWGAVAACLAVVLYAGIRYAPPSISGPDTSDPLVGIEDLPMLTLSFEDGGMGFEGCLAYDISELENGNPWTECIQLKTLPVFTNTAYSGRSGLPVSDIETERLVKIAEQAAHTLDMEITDFTYDQAGDIMKDSNIESDTVYRVIGTTDTAKIIVYANCSVTVNFDEGVILPELYSFTFSNTSDEAAANVTDYLLERFSELISFTEPHKALFADYTFDGTRSRSYYVYDGAGDITDQILNYNFRQVQFAPDDDGNLSLIRISNNLSYAEKIGDYPIISPEDARKLLLDGYYITSVSEKMPGEKYVRKVELIYRTGNINETFLPYYRFWIELPDMLQENGLKTFGAYYVPAVQQKYITSMPLWDGSFN